MDPTTIYVVGRIYTNVPRRAYMEIKNNNTQLN